MSASVDLGIVVEEIEKFEQNGFNGELSTTLERYLQLVAQSGDPLLPWNTIKGIIKFKLVKVIGEFYDLFGGEELVDTANTPPFSYLPTRTKILQHFDSFVGAPFTIQRLCEILVNPKRHYKRTDKLLRGLEKNVYVVSFIEPGHSKQNSCGDSQNDSIANGIQEMSPPQVSNSPANDSSLKVSMIDNVSSETEEVTLARTSEERVNGSVISNGMDDGSSSSSSSPSSSTSSSPTPDEDLREPSGPSPKRPRLELNSSTDSSLTINNSHRYSTSTLVDDEPSHSEGRLLSNVGPVSVESDDDEKLNNSSELSDSSCSEVEQNPSSHPNLMEVQPELSSSYFSAESKLTSRVSPKTSENSIENINSDQKDVAASGQGLNDAPPSLPSRLEDMEVVESSDDSKVDSDNECPDVQQAKSHHLSVEGSPDSAQDSEHEPSPYSENHMQAKENCSEATAALENEINLASAVKETSPQKNCQIGGDSMDSGEGSSSEADSTCSQSNHLTRHSETQSNRIGALDSTSSLEITFPSNQQQPQQQQEQHEAQTATTAEANSNDSEITETETFQPPSIDSQAQVISTTKDASTLCPALGHPQYDDSSCSSSDS